MATEVAMQLQMKRIIVPPSPGLFSAFGLLFSKIEHEYVQTLFRRSEDIDESEMEQTFRVLEEQARLALKADGFLSKQMAFIHQADLRYSGQAYELTVPVATTSKKSTIFESFGEEHQRTYGHRNDDEPIDLVNLRVVGWADPPGPKKIDPKVAISVRSSNVEPRINQRKAFFGAIHGLIDTQILIRSDLLDGKVRGPLIVEEYDATTLVPPGWNAELDSSSNIIITKE